MRGGVDPEALSEREREVLALVVRGVRTAAIAKSLDVSPDTVKSHLTSLYRKLGVTSRWEAQAWARRTGWTGDTTRRV